MRVKIRKGDTVEVISGRLEDKGKRGEVINVFLDERRVVEEQGEAGRRVQARKRVRHLSQKRAERGAVHPPAEPGPDHAVEPDPAAAALGPQARARGRPEAEAAPQRRRR